MGMKPRMLQAPLDTHERLSKRLDMEPYEGGVKVGDQFIWAPYKPTCRLTITVVSIEVNADNEVWIGSKPDGLGVCWNALARFREAVVPSPSVPN